MGAPSVGIEKLPRGDEPLVALRALEAHTGQRVTHLIAGDICGANAMQPLIQSVLSGLSAVDGDGMGRAFPELQHCTFSISGIACTPTAIADCHHNTVVFPALHDTHTLERFARTVTVQMAARCSPRDADTPIPCPPFSARPMVWRCSVAGSWISSGG